MVMTINPSCQLGALLLLMTQPNFLELDFKMQICGWKWVQKQVAREPIYWFSAY